MQLHNEFFVQVAPERAWETLLDIQTVAGFLPGATIEPPDEDGAYRGRMKLKVGPVVTTYRGTARLSSVDAEAREVVLEVSANEAQGQGTAAAVIRNVLIPENGGTRVTADTDLRVTGRQAQFGRGLMQDVAGRTLDEFARRFEAYLTSPASEPRSVRVANDAGDASPPAAANHESDALDLGAAVGRAAGRQLAIPGVILAVAIIWLVRRARRSSQAEARQR